MHSDNHKHIEVRNRTNELKKHVGTIHSSNPLTLVQRKISNALLYNAYPKLQDQDEYEIEIKYLCNLIGYDSNDHKLIKQGLKKLLSTVIEWNLLKADDDEVWTASSMLASVSIKGPVCTYSYSSHMKKLLYMPAVYGRVNMLVQSQFKSSYGLALYENCIRYQNLSYSGWFTIGVFRKLMGVSEDTYKVFRDFKRRIIDRAVEEVNKHSNLRVTPEYKKINRKVESIRFKIEKKSDQSISKEGIKEELTNNWEFSADDAKSLISCYGESLIEDKITSIISSSSFVSGTIRSKSAYLKKVLASDYEVPKTKYVKYRDYEHKQYLSSEQSNNSSPTYDKAIEIIKSLGKESEVIKEYENLLKNNHSKLLLPIYNKDGFDHLGVRAVFVQFVYDKFRDYF